MFSLVIIKIRQFRKDYPAETSTCCINKDSPAVFQTLTFSIPSHFCFCSQNKKKIAGWFIKGWIFYRVNWLHWDSSYAREDFVSAEEIVQGESYSWHSCLLCCVAVFWQQLVKKYFRNKYFRSVKLVPFQCAYSSGGKYKDARGVWIEVFTSFRSFQIIMFSIQMYEK